MGNAASRPAPLLYGVQLLSEMATQRDLATDARPDSPEIANAVREGGAVHRCYCRFSIRQDSGKKGEVYGFDGGKKVKGRKRHIVVYSQGLLIGVLVTEANASERLGAIVVLDEAKEALAVRLVNVFRNKDYFANTKLMPF